MLNLLQIYHLLSMLFPVLDGVCDSFALIANIKVPVYFELQVQSHHEWHTQGWFVSTW